MAKLIFFAATVLLASQASAKSVHVESLLRSSNPDDCTQPTTEKSCDANSTCTWYFLNLFS